MTSVHWNNKRIELEFKWTDDSAVRLVRMSDMNLAPAPAECVSPRQVLVEILAPAWGRNNNSQRYAGTKIGAGLRYVDSRAETEGSTHRLEIVQRHRESGLVATSIFEAGEGIPAIRTWTRLSMETGRDPLMVWAVTSFATGAVISDSINAVDVLQSQSGWIMENRWKTIPLRSQGLLGIAPETRGEYCQDVISATALSTRSSERFNPVGAMLDRDSGEAVAWQVEHNGGWHWEIGEKPGLADGEFPPDQRLMDESPAGALSPRRSDDQAYLAILGPTDSLHQWSMTMSPEEAFETVPIAFTVGDGVENVLANLGAHRRATRRPHAQNETLPVVFNDYMNTLRGDPTEGKLLPLIAAAASVGAEYFCIDAGWYDDTAGWWASVGDWWPSTKRFPSGLGSVIEEIRTKGMVPGLWLEPEVVGVNSSIAGRLPLAAFLQRDGQRVREADRYFLDLRHPASIEHLDEAVDRLIADFGIGYFKFDYNVTPGAGTDVNGTSPGFGLLEHNRALLCWLSSLLDRHPGLIIENCAAGAMRSDFGMLGVLQLQSTSDQQDPLLNPLIAVGALGHILPEQAANWAYPQAAMSDEEIIFTMCAGLAGRLYQAGVLNEMDSRQLELVRAGVQAHKLSRRAIARSTVRFPTGLPSWESGWVTVAFESGHETYVVAWRQADAAPVVDLALSHLSADGVTVDQVFPPLDRGEPWSAQWSNRSLKLRSENAVASARMFRLVSPEES